jgi:hypothetical protein
LLDLFLFQLNACDQKGIRLLILKDKLLRQNSCGRCCIVQTGGGLQNMVVLSGGHWLRLKLLVLWNCWRYNEQQLIARDLLNEFLEFADEFNANQANEFGQHVIRKDLEESKWARSWNLGKFVKCCIVVLPLDCSISKSCLAAAIQKSQSSFRLLWSGRAYTACFLPYFERIWPIFFKTKTSLQILDASFYFSPFTITRD